MTTLLKHSSNAPSCDLKTSSLQIKPGESTRDTTAKLTQQGYIPKRITSKAREHQPKRNFQHRPLQLTDDDTSEAGSEADYSENESNIISHYPKTMSTPNTITTSNFNISLNDFDTSDDEKLTRIWKTLGNILTRPLIDDSDTDSDEEVQKPNSESDFETEPRGSRRPRQ